MSLLSLFKKKESLLSIDIGSSAVKLIELDIKGSQPRIVNIAMAPIPADCFSNNSIAKTDKVSEQITNLIEANSIAPRRVATAVPAPSVFTKRVKVQKMSFAELGSYIELEASNLIPHSLDAVRLDYQVMGQTEDDQLDLLVVAVKNEIIDSYLEGLSLSGLETALVDVDYFALQNMFELGYSELHDKTVAIINIGARYSSVNICRQGGSLFTGDIAVGGRTVTDSLVEEMNLTIEEAEKIKRKAKLDEPEFEAARSVISKSIDYLATEFSRQLSFFWSAAGSEGGIDKIFLSGGGALLTGLSEEISTKTEIECERIDPFKGIDTGDTFEGDYLKEIAPYMGIAVGLGIRQLGDRIIPDFD